MNRSLFHPSMDDITARVAIAYENLQRGKFSKLDSNKLGCEKRELIRSNKGVCYSKRNNNEFVIFLVLTPYIIHVNNEYYQFEGIPIGNLFRIKNDLIEFTGPPKVLRNTYYHHPFVYETTLNKICFGDDDSNGRWRREDLDIRWNIGYRTTDDLTIHKIAKWLDEGRFVIEQGYFGNWSKVHSLSESNFPSEYKTYVEAKRNGVRIIEPKKTTTGFS